MAEPCACAGIRLTRSCDHCRRAATCYFVPETGFRDRVREAIRGLPLVQDDRFDYRVQHEGASDMVICCDGPDFFTPLSQDPAAWEHNQQAAAAVHRAARDNGFRIRRIDYTCLRVADVLRADGIGAVAYGTPTLYRGFQQLVDGPGEVQAGEHKSLSVVGQLLRHRGAPGGLIERKVPPPPPPVARPGTARPGTARAPQCLHINLKTGKQCGNTTKDVTVLCPHHRPDN